MLATHEDHSVRNRWRGHARVAHGVDGEQLKSRPCLDNANPVVRDRREACGNVAMGVGLRPSAKELDAPPNPKVPALQIYPDLLSSL